MSAHRIIQMPLSGGDRKAFARELRRVEQRHANLRSAIAEARQAESAYRLQAQRLECEEWSARLYLGGDVEPSPLICDAIDAGMTLLQVKCGSCKKERDIVLTDFIWPRDKAVHTLRPIIFCQPCKTDTGRKIRPQMIGLFAPTDPSCSPAAAAR